MTEEERAIVHDLLALAVSNELAVEGEWGSLTTADAMRKDPTHANWDPAIQKARALLGEGAP